MKKLYIIILFFLLSVKGFGQFYPLEAGITGGLSPGFTFRVFLDEQLSYESQLTFRYEGVQLNLFRQSHREIEMTENGTLYFISGFGLHGGFYYTDVYSNYFRRVEYDEKVFSPVAGVDGYFAVEYRLHEAPISFGLSYKPFAEFSLREIVGLNFWDFGFTFAYRFQEQGRHHLEHRFLP